MSRVEEKEVVQCKNKKVETKSKQQMCQALSPTVFNDKNCQAEKVKCGQGSHQRDMQLDKLAMLIQHKMSKKQKQVPQEDDKNCQINRRPLKSNMYADKKS